MPAPIGRAMGLGVVLGMDNRLSGPALAASSSMGVLTTATDKAAVSQMRFSVAMKTGAVALVGAAGAAVALGLVTSAAAKFETGMTNVAAILRPTTQELNILTDAAIRAGIATQFSPKQATEGLKDLATAGFTATESAEALFPVLDLATGSLGQLGVSGAATAAAAAVRGFGFETKETAKVVDILLRSTQLTNIQARDLQVMLSRAGGAARAAGQEFEETVAILGALRNVGIEASATGTTFRSALRAMTQTTAKAELQKLNVALFDSQDNFRNVSDVVFDLNKKFADMTEKQREASTKIIFGARGLQLFNAVTAMGAENMSSLVGSLKNASGTAAEFRKRVLEPLSGRLVLMAGSVATLASQIGAPLLSPLKTAVTLFTRFLNFMIKLTQTFPLLTKIIVRTAGLVTLIVGLTGAILVLSSALLMLNLRYGLVTKAKAAFFFITRLLIGTEEFSRKQILLSLFVEKLRLTQTDLMNAKTKVRIILEKILGIGISSRASITWAAVSAATAERIQMLGANAALIIQNTLRKISNLLTLKGIKGMFLSAKAGIASSTAMTGAAGATGLLTGAVKGLTLAMLANPILLIITGVIVFAIVLVKLTKAFDNAKGASKAMFATLLILLSPIGLLIVIGKTLATAWNRNLGGVKKAFAGMKSAIMSIFEPLGKLFAATEGGGGGLARLFTSLMTLFFKPLALAFEKIGFVATQVGNLVTFFVKELGAVFAPVAPAIDELSQAFDDMTMAVFGPGKKNLGFWKRFSDIGKTLIRLVLVPMGKITLFLVKAFAFLARAVTAIISPVSRAVRAVKDVVTLSKGVRTGIKVGLGVASPGLGLGLGLLGLQHGGITTRPTTARLSEKGGTEMVTPLPPGLRPADLAEVFKGAMARGRFAIGGGGEGGSVTIVIENRIILDGREIQRNQREIADLDELRSFVA